MVLEVEELGSVLVTIVLVLSPPSSSVVVAIVAEELSWMDAVTVELLSSMSIDAEGVVVSLDSSVFWSSKDAIGIVVENGSEANVVIVDDLKSSLLLSKGDVVVSSAS